MGTILIVVRGHLANGKYPTAYWRSENALTVLLAGSEKRPIFRNSRQIDTLLAIPI